MRVEQLNQWSRRLYEALRPNHVAAQAQGQAPHGIDQVNGYANLIEGEIDKVLHNLRVNRDVAVWHQKDQAGLDHVHVRIKLSWPSMGVFEGLPQTGARIGTDWMICRFPSELLEQIQQVVITRYERAGWTMKITPTQTEMTHPS
jgi:hypothetical protein